MLQLKRVSEVEGLKVYTDNGELFGEIEAALMKGNKIDSWKIRAVRDSFITKTINARGVIVPHQFVRSIGDVMIVSKAAAPSHATEGIEPKE